MVYVKHFDILGIDTAQIPCIELQGAPNSATVGAVGLLGMDVTSDSGDIYVCTAVNGAVYTWKSLRDGKDGTCVTKSEINDNGELILTLSSGETLNAGVVKGEPGKDGVDGRDGVGIAAINIWSGELCLSLSDGTYKNFGSVIGKDGAKGQDGVSITNVERNASHELVITLSNGTVMNLGSVKGDKGDEGGTAYRHGIIIEATSAGGSVQLFFDVITPSAYSEAFNLHTLYEYFTLFSTIDGYVQPVTGKVDKSGVKGIPISLSFRPVPNGVGMVVEYMIAGGFSTVDINSYDINIIDDVIRLD